MTVWRKEPQQNCPVCFTKMIYLFDTDMFICPKCKTEITKTWVEDNQNATIDQSVTNLLDINHPRFCHRRP